MPRRSALTSLALLALVAAAPLFLPSAARAASSKLPSRSEVLATMNLVAGYARNRYTPNTEAYWDDGVYHIGMMALHEAAGSAAALAYTAAFGTYNHWTLDRGVVAANRHNRLAAAQSWIAAQGASPGVDITDVRAEIANQSSLSMAEVTSSAYFAVDAQFMALPAFAMLGRLDTDSRYFDRLYELFSYNKTTLGLYDATAHLYYRDATYIYPARQSPAGKKVFWSRGNGWALAALARILRDLPRSDPMRAEYVATFKELSAALKAAQRPDGFWNMSLHDPTHHPGPEVSGTALFVYGMAWGINNGLLSRATYRPVVARAWNAMAATAVHPDGKLGYVQGIGQHPVPTSQVTYESTADFGVGVFLLAGSELVRMTVDGVKYEAEELAATVSPGDARQEVHDAAASGGTYSRGVFDAVADYVQYSVWLPTAGTYNVKIRFGRAPDMGRWQFYTAGSNLGAPQDAYSSEFRFSEVNLGNVTFRTLGSKVFRFTAAGRHSASSGYSTAIDYVMLTRQ